jgi:hypothetical protein
MTEQWLLWVTIYKNLTEMNVSQRISYVIQVTLSLSVNFTFSSVHLNNDIRHVTQ